MSQLHPVKEPLALVMAGVPQTNATLYHRIRF